MLSGRAWLWAWLSWLILASRAAGAGQPPCAKALVLVAHRDDETFFAGEALLGRRASLPGRCRRAKWHVVVVTGGQDPRTAQELATALDVARVHTRAASITEEVWDFDDCNHALCKDFPGPGPPIAQRLQDLLATDEWDYVVTHNEQGEYHHTQHAGLHWAVKAAVAAAPRPPQLFVFNPMPELNVSVSLGKQRMLQAYIRSTPTWARRLTVQSLARFSEHLVPAEAYSRPPALGVFFTHGMDDSFDIPFGYDWIVYSQYSDMQLSVDDCILSVQDLFFNMWIASCRGSGLPWYPDICRHLHQQMDGVRPHLAAMIQQMKAMEEYFKAESTVQPPAPGTPSLRCAQMQPIEIFGEISRWEVQAKIRRASFLSVFVLRKIVVGWKQGYKGRTYKIISPGGPRLVASRDSIPNTITWRQLEPLAVQPGDVVGWEIFPDITNLTAYPPVPEPHAAAELCLGARGCDEAGLCTFDIQPPEEWTANLRIRRVAVEVVPRQQVPRQAPFFEVMPALNISEYVDARTSYEEFMTVRQKLDHPDLGIFEDKIRLRTELLPAAGVLGTPSIHLSNHDFDVARFLHGRRSYVVKPSHMSESQNVFVVHEGNHLLRKAWGHPGQVSIDEIQAAVYEFSKKAALDWECQALVSSKPGVIVEELVMGQAPDGSHMVDEWKFYTVFGRVMFGENIISSAGTLMEISREGGIIMTKMSCPPFCVRPCYAQMVEIAEKVATHARTDFLRVDLLVAGNCDGLYISEVELFPASDFSPFLKEAVAARWRRGYGV